MMDSKSIGLCPQGFKSPRCRLSAISFWKEILIRSAEPKSTALTEPGTQSLVSRCFANPKQKNVSVCLPRKEYTWPGSNWRPSACEADVIATRPQVLDIMLCVLDVRNYLRENVSARHTEKVMGWECDCLGQTSIKPQENRNTG